MNQETVAFSDSVYHLSIKLRRLVVSVFVLAVNLLHLKCSQLILAFCFVQHGKVFHVLLGHHTWSNHCQSSAKEPCPWSLTAVLAVTRKRLYSLHKAAFIEHLPYRSCHINGTCELQLHGIIITFSMNCTVD